MQIEFGENNVTKCLLGRGKGWTERSFLFTKQTKFMFFPFIMIIRTTITNIQFIHLYSILVLVVGNGQTALAVSSIVEMAIQIGSGVE